VFELTSYVGLFLAAFGAATLLPMQSEAVLVGMLLTDRYVVSTLLAVATFGNVLGSVLNWILGRSVERFRHKRWFPVSESKLEKAQQSYLRYGRWSLLLSWVPSLAIR
jgi:membrane protein YqaA with SNARE-associated domain